MRMSADNEGWIRRGRSGLRTRRLLSPEMGADVPIR
jgi:hypothetical protein